MMPLPPAATSLNQTVTSNSPRHRPTTSRPLHTSLRPNTRAGVGSTTQTVTASDPLPEIGVLRLRGEHVPRQGIRWAEDVVDNEGLGRKSSKGVLLHVHLSRSIRADRREDVSGFVLIVVNW